MNRRQFLFRSSLLAASAFVPFPKRFAAKAEGQFTPLRRDVGYFTDRGGTIGWLANDDALVVVDAQFPDTAKVCLDGLRKKSSHSLDMLINTHHHGDHTGGNPVFKPYAGKMVAHENVPKLMKKASKGNDNNTDPAYPTTTFSDSWKADVGDETVHATYYGPGHTSGDSVIYFEKANIVHMGDLVFNRMNPYTDRPSGASIHNWVDILTAVEKEYPSDALYIFGHGKAEFGVTGNSKDIAVMRTYLSALIDYVNEGIEAGKSMEEIADKQAMGAFPQFAYADWWKLSDNLKVIYQEAME